MMEKVPNNKIEKDENQTKEDTKRKALEKVRQKATVINIEEIAEAERRKGADAYMTEDKASGLKKFWKHTVAEGFYRTREVTRVGKEIKETGNIYTRRIGDNPDKSAHKSAMKGITDRFRADYEDNLVLSKGEERKFLDDNDVEVVKIKTDLKNLLDNYAIGNLDEDTFNNSKKGIIDSLKTKEDLLKGADNYADNLFEIAQNARIAYEHGAKLGELDYDLGLIIGKAKSSLKTEAHFNLVDKTIDRMKKSKVGKFISPTVLSIGVGVAYSVITGVNAIASTKLGQVVGGIGSLGISVGISTIFAAANESQRVEDEKKQHNLDMVEGGGYKPGDKRREQMAKFEYGTEKSIVLSQRLRDLMFEKDEDGNDVVKDIKAEDVKDIIACLGNIDARKSLNENKKIDLISYSNIGNVEKESTDLTLLTAKAKLELENRVKTDLKNGLPEGVNSYEEYLNSVTNTIKDSLLGGEKGINAQDKTYRRYKAWRVTKKAAINATVGIIVGGTLRELMAIGSEHVQGLFNHPGGATTETPARHLFDIITGHNPHMDMGNSTLFEMGNHNFQVPEGVSILQNGNAIDIMKGDHLISHFIPEYNADGTLDATTIANLSHDGILSTGIHNVINSTQEVSTDAQGWSQNHPGETIQVHHNNVGPFMDNNSPSVPDPANPGHMLGADGNELGMQWGGVNGSGLNANGDAVLNISHMDSIHSIHGDISVNVPQEMQNGNLMALIYLDGGSPIPVEVQPNGDIIFDHNNPIMQQIFKPDADGNIISHAKVIELVQKMGTDENGVHQVRAISAIVGEGLDKIKDIISLNDDVVVNQLAPSLDVQSLPFIPGVARKPLEPVTFGREDKKPKEEDTNVVPDIVVPYVIPDVVPDIVVPSEIKAIEFKVSLEEKKGMEDDVRMLNKKEQESKGIITLSRLDFKSEYGRRRYDELKHIPDGKPVLFNDDELRMIGDEIDNFLRGDVKIEPIKIKEIGQFSEDNPLGETELKQEYEKAKASEKSIFMEFETFVKEHPNEKIPVVLEDRYREAEKNLENARNKINDLEKKKEESINILGPDGVPLKKNLEKSVYKDEVKNEEKKIVKPVEDKKEEVETKEEKKERKFTKKDLSKVGTEFESDLYTFKIIRVSSSFLGPKKIFVDAIKNKKTGKLVEQTDEKTGKKQDIVFSEKALKGELDSGIIKITKVLEKSK